MPAYLEVPELIADDLRQGRLAPRDRLPPLRVLAECVGINYTTMVRGIAEASQRGLVASRPGMGTYIRGTSIGLPLRSGAGVEMTMNLPPEVEDHPVVHLLQEGAAHVVGTAPLHDLMRYQDFGGTERDRVMAAEWIRQWLPDVLPERLLVAPGIHAALLALVSMLVTNGRRLCVEELSYPGIKAIATQLGVPLLPLTMDGCGVDPDDFDSACRRTAVGALYICPNVHNPTTTTMSIERREALITVARRHQVPIIEDDAYGMLPPATPPPLADLAPDITYFVTGLSKWLGAGLRTSYVVTPNAATRLRTAGALRATTVMASPFVNAVVSHWFEMGLATQVLDAVRNECAFRSDLARQRLAPLGVRLSPHGFHAWLPTVPRSDQLATDLRALGVAAVAASAFCTRNGPPDALRLCLGGAFTREDCVRALDAVVSAMQTTQAEPRRGNMD